VHIGQQKGEFVMGVRAGTPYFTDIPKLWRKHRGTKRTAFAVGSPEGLEIVADLGRHFPEDCKT
jgi:hypothetical protein